MVPPTKFLSKLDSPIASGSHPLHPHDTDHGTVLSHFLDAKVFLRGKRFIAGSPDKVFNFIWNIHRPNKIPKPFMS